MSSYVDIELIDENPVEVEVLTGTVTFLGGISLGETSSTAYRGDRGKIAYDHSQETGNPHNLTVSDIPDFSAALILALSAYTPTSGLAAVALSGNAADLLGTLDNSRLSAQVVRNDFNYADPSWINSLAASKITGSFVNITATGNGFINGNLQIGGLAGHLLRWNAGAASLEVRDSTNAFYRKTRVGELQIIADLGGSNATPANARLGFLTQVGGYIAGAISARTYSANAAHGDVVISASLNMTTGQNDYSTQTDDLVLRGNTGNVEINRGLLSIGMAGQAARSLSILPANTADRSGIRIYDYGAFSTSTTQSGLEIAYLGGTFAAPSTTVSGHYRNLLSFRTGGATGALSTVPSFAIRSVIGSIIGSSLSEVNTSLMVTPTSTGVPIAALTMFGQSGLVDFPVGQIQLGTSVRLKNNSGDLQIRNSGDTDFAGISASTGNFSNIIYANNGVRVSGSAGMQFSSATPVPGSGSLPWLMYTANSNTLFTRDANNSRMFLTMTGGANSSSSNLQIHANSYVEGSLFLSGSGGAVFASATPAVVGGSHPWLIYTANSSVLYIRDATNGRMHVTYTQGASAAAALTQFHSRVTVDDYLTSAFQSLAADPTTSDVASGLLRIVKNTTTGEIAGWGNDGGVMRKFATSRGALNFRIDGGGAAPATGAKSVMFRVPYKCTIIGWYLAADVSGSVVVDIWKNATYPPVNADSITASAKPTLSSALSGSSTTLTGWVTALNEGDYIEIEVESASALTAFALTLTVARA